MANNQYIIGIDVGTGSVRAGIFDQYGTMRATQSHPIKIWKPEPNFVEQSSDDVWASCCKSVKGAVQKAGINPKNIQGIGFDATCSMVVLDKNDQPVTVSTHGSDERNIIVWMDHRAAREADEINQTGYEVLKYVGGTISPEMETPKLLWLKKHLPETWEKAAKFFDLADFLAYKATGIDARSVCTTTCKWTYLAHENRWEDAYFQQIGLEDLVDENYERIGQHIKPVGQRVGAGLTRQAATDFNLQPGTAVGIGIIDAHAGGLGLLGMNSPSEEEGSINLENRIALIGGTSSCHMAVSEKPQFIDGVWGPYYSAMIPEMWLTEGGQSATGALIDHIIFSSDQSTELKKEAVEKSTTVYQLLNERLYSLARSCGLEDVSKLTTDLHLLPYFHGNRSPRADASSLGSISGLSLSSTIDDLALLYLAAIQGIAYGTRHIIESLNGSGYSINKIMATGGGTKNELFLKIHADICGCQIILPKETEAVLLGSAILGAVAAGIYPSVLEAMQKMNHAGRVVDPVGKSVKDYHDAKYRIFHKMYHDQKSYSKIMEASVEKV